jgi:Pectate lyase superfamily protein
MASRQATEPLFGPASYTMGHLSRPRRSMSNPTKNRDDSHKSRRREMLGRLAASGGALAYASSSAASGIAGLAPSPDKRSGSWFEVRDDFNAVGDGKADDTRALQSAINAGSEAVRPVRVAPGAYRITQPLFIPPNTMLVGSAPGLGFGCRIEPTDCPALLVGGKSSSFQCSIEDLLIWPRGSAPEYLVCIDNSYSVTFRNIRIHEAQEDLKRAAVVLLGHPAAGGHGRCINIIWDNLIVRNDSRQPPVAILAARGCGSHRFIAPDLENYRVLLEWRGGQLDLVTPYAERAGQYAVNCNIDAEEEDTTYLNTFGGTIDSAPSGIGCAIRETTRNFNSFGTLWGPTSGRAAHVYSLPGRPITFFGTTPDIGKGGQGGFGGARGWQSLVNFPQQFLRVSHLLAMKVPAHDESFCEVRVPGVFPEQYWARVTATFEIHKVQLTAYVSAVDTVRIVADNLDDRQANLNGTFTVECGAV